MPPPRIDRDHFSPDTVALLEILARHGVRYVVAGGEAVIFHGHARLTGDVDFFYDRDPPNAERLYRALCEFWQGPAPGLSGAAELTRPGLVLQYGVPPNRIDLINEIDGVTFEQAWAGRVEALLSAEPADVPVAYLGLDELLRN